MRRALIFVSEAGARETLTGALEEDGLEIVVASSLDEVHEELEKGGALLLVLDACPEDGDLTDLLGPGRAAGIEATILVDSTPPISPETPLGRAGVSAFLATPLDLSGLRAFLARTAPLSAQISDPEESRFGLLVGNAPPMRSLYSIMRRVGPSRANVLISGESGSGKELVARTLHDLSPRRKKPFLPVNCGALTATLMESELFGHERGSFTGADRRHRGYFERADGGTLFLDEITEMPAELQVKLLRVLESGLVTGVGREEPVAVDVRVVAATNRDPAAAVSEGKLREDLYYRLRVLQIEVPPLRDRLEDLPLLVDWFLREIGEREGRQKHLGEDVMEALQRHRWPGNVRELRNVLYTLHLMSPHERIPVSVLPADILDAASEGDARPQSRASESGRSLKEIEKDHILLTLEELDGHKRKASEVLGISLKTLYNRLHEYGEMGVEDGESGSS
ncbi:MAG: sigma-54-dependent Fis family transcriptional regulator [Gemmatimonadales bacterium]|nr:MAG: sigma-54-dependent Fis family transcriptional regulator [Gemmatimonadales bacterium]